MNIKKNICFLLVFLLCVACSKPTEKIEPQDFDISDLIAQMTPEPDLTIGKLQYMSFKYDEIYLTMDTDDYELVIETTPINYYEETVSYSTTSKDVIEINESSIKAVKEGVTTLSYSIGDFSDEMIVHILPSRDYKSNVVAEFTSDTLVWMQDYETLCTQRKKQIKYVPSELVIAINNGFEYEMYVDVNNLYENDYSMFPEFIENWLHVFDTLSPEQIRMMDFRPLIVVKAIERGFDYNLYLTEEDYKETGLDLFSEDAKAWIEWYNKLSTDEKKQVDSLPMELISAIQGGRYSDIKLFKDIDQYKYFDDFNSLYE